MLSTKDLQGYYAPRMAFDEPMVRGALTPKTSKRKRSNDTVHYSRPFSPAFSENGGDTKAKFSFSMAKTALFDRSKRIYNKLTTYKQYHMEDLQQNEDLALNYAIAESCFTYVQERNYTMSGQRQVEISGRLTGAIRNLNNQIGYNYF